MMMVPGPGGDGISEIAIVVQVPHSDVEDADEVVHGCLEEAVEEVGHFYTRHHLCKPLAM